MRNRLPLRLTLAAALLVLMAGCGKDTESPTSPGAGPPEAAPALATAAAALSFMQVSPAAHILAA
jgi:hypothetical protein